MAIQDEFGRIGFFEDFQGYAASVTIADATAGTQYNDVTLIAIGEAVTAFSTVDESGGVASFQSDAANAGEGISITSGHAFVPSSNGIMRMGARFKGSSATDLRVFVGFQETVSMVETVNPFTLSGTSLTSNNGGNVVGFYTDTSADTDDFRFHSSLDGAESTTAALSDAIDGSTTLGALGIRAKCTITADSWYVAKVIVNPDGSAEGWFGGAGMDDQRGLTRVARMEAGTLDVDAVYFPLLLSVAGATGDPLHEVDYFWAKGNRDWNA